MSMFGRHLIQNVAPVEEYTDPETGKKKRRRLAPPESCPHCGDDVMVMVRGEVIVGGTVYTRSVPCKWCERGTQLATKLQRGRRHERRVEVNLHYEDDAVHTPDADPADDVELSWRWLETGWKREQDGLLRSIHTGEAAPLQPPEFALPPLPDGTRPPREKQRTSGEARRDLHQRVRSHLTGHRERRAPFTIRIQPGDGEASVAVVGMFGVLHQAVVVYDELGKASPSRSELQRVCEVAHQEFDAVLAALRDAARTGKPREVSPRRAESASSGEQAG